MTKEYVRRINLAVAYIQANLEQELNLGILANISSYSPFHFHRLFTALVGENPNKYILRLRIERAAYQLKKDKNLPVSEVAFNNGFESNSSFSKAFKKHYGISPTFFRKHADQHSKIRQINSKNGQQLIKISEDIGNMNTLKHIAKRTAIAVKELPAVKVAYVSHTGAFNEIGAAYDKLLKWAVPRNLFQGQLITRFHDSPEVTDLSRIRQSACIAISEAPEKSKQILLSTIDGGKHAVGKFTLEIKEIDNAWQTVMIWVAEHGFVPDEKKTCFEIYHNRTTKTPSEKLILEICVPIKSQA